MKCIKIIILIVCWAVSVSNLNAEIKNIDIICDDWPPYQMVEDHQLSGFSTRIVKIVFERMKVTINSIKVYPWKRAIKMVETGKTDALFSANYTKNRTEFAFYPDEKIVDSPWVMWVREEDGFKFESFDDLLGKKIGIVRGYSYTPEFWEFLKKHNNYYEITNDEQNFKKLNVGRVDFVPAELGNGLYLVKKLDLSGIIPLRKNPLKSDGLYIIFNKTNVSKSFVDTFSNELKQLKQEPLYIYLYNEYFKSTVLKSSG